jgi:tetratricopeptide (TPR) repeat protein
MEVSVLRLRALVEGRPLVLAVAASCFLPLVTASTAHAQRDFSRFQGKVVDEEGRPLEGAKIRVTDVARGRERDTETNEKGEFRFRILLGEYEVTVAKENYRGVEEKLRFRDEAGITRDYRLVIGVTPAEDAFRQGVTAFNAGNLKEAAQAFEKAAELAPKLVQAHTNLAAAYIRLNRNEDALRELQKAVELAPNSFQISVQLAATYAQLKRYEEAVATFQTALAIEHQISDPAVHDAWMNLGILHLMKDRTREAIGAFEKALVSNPRSPRALLSLGKSLFNIGEPTGAIERFRQVVAVAPDSKEAGEARTLIAEFEKSRTDR